MARQQKQCLELKHLSSSSCHALNSSHLSKPSLSQLQTVEIIPTLQSCEALKEIVTRLNMKCLVNWKRLHGCEPTNPQHLHLILFLTALSRHETENSAELTSSELSEGYSKLSWGQPGVPSPCCNPTGPMESMWFHNGAWPPMGGKGQPG